MKSFLKVYFWYEMTDIEKRSETRKIEKLKIFTVGTKQYSEEQDQSSSFAKIMPYSQDAIYNFRAVFHGAKSG